MVRLRVALAFLALTLVPLAQATEPAGSLGYDARGQLVEQPRIKLNMFALADSAAEADKADLRAFGQWIADALQVFADVSAQAQERIKPAEASKAATGARPRSAPDRVKELEQRIELRLASAGETLARLKQLRPPKLRHPDIARALAFAQRDFAEAAPKLERVLKTESETIKAVFARDVPAVRDTLIDSLQGVASLMEWADRSNKRQIEAGVGGTPDLWLWRAGIDESQAMATLFRDLVYAVEHRRAPPAVGQQNIQENLTAMAEWLKRAEIQVRQEMQRARTSPEASLTRGQWLEKVYANYEQQVAVERALYRWMTANLARIYEDMRLGTRDERAKARLINWSAHEKMESASLALTIERYRLLAAMP